MSHDEVSILLFIQPTTTKIRTLSAMPLPKSPVLTRHHSSSPSWVSSSTTGRVAITEPST